MTKDKTVFFPLPHSLRRDIYGGCQCKFCKEHPHDIPQWDTLAYDPIRDVSWSVHMPERSHGKG